MTFPTFGDRPFWRPTDAVRAVALPWLLARALVPAALFVARHVADELGVTPEPDALAEGLFSWDAAFYEDIARRGYDGVDESGLRFFPLFPLLARAIGAIPGVSIRVAMLVIASVAAAGAGVLLHALSVREQDDEDLARRSVWFLMLAPSAFVLVMGYAEALFLLLSIACFLALRSGRWTLAGVLGLLAALARPVGVLLVVPAAIEAWRGARDGLPRERFTRPLAVVGPPLGLFCYLAWVDHRTHDFWTVFRVYDDPELRGGTVAPWSSLADAARAIGDADQVMSGLHFVSAIALVALLVVLGRRWPASYTAYGAATLVVVLSASTLNSLERYAVACFPFVLAAATLVRRAALERSALVLAGSGLVALSVLAFLGLHVP